jgi:hypothetical protein
MSLVLVVARPPVPAAGLTAVLHVLRGSDPAAGKATSGGAAPDPAGAPVSAPPTDARPDVWGSVRREVQHLRASSTVTPRRLEDLAIAQDVDPHVAYAASPGEAIDAVRERIAEGADAVAVVPVALAIDGVGADLRDPGLIELHRGLDDIGREHPGVEIQYVGPPFDDTPALESVVAALRPAGSDEPALLAGAIQRAFDGDLDRFARFMAALQSGVPAGTRIVLRGSAVQGESYRTGEPFDARGPRTSDLDVVLLGDAVMAEWAPGAFYLPGVNSEPLYDDAPDVASPALERARAAAQEAAGRPVALQAMARWFLDVRSGLQGTPYVVLG